MTARNLSETKHELVTALTSLADLAQKAGATTLRERLFATASRGSRRSARCSWCSASSTTARPPS